MALFAPKRFGSTFPTTGYTSSGRKTAGIGHDLSRFRFLRIASARSIPRPVAALREMPTPLSSTTPGHRTRKLPDLPSGLENCRHERNGLAATQKHSALGEVRHNPLFWLAIVTQSPMRNGCHGCADLCYFQPLTQFGMNDLCIMRGDYTAVDKVSPTESQCQLRRLCRMMSLCTSHADWVQDANFLFLSV